MDRVHWMDASRTSPEWQDSIVSHASGDVGVELVHPVTGLSFRLNQTGAALWNLAARREKIEDAILTFQQAFPQEPALRIEDDIRDLARRLAMLELVSVENGILSRMDGVSATAVEEGANVEDANGDDFDKYWYYHDAVQSPDIDAKFYRRVYREINGGEPKTFREDFCGTFKLCCEWVKLNKKYKAVGVDLDLEPIQYGVREHLQTLNSDQQRRVSILRKNVLEKDLPGADIIVAVNFSYFIFRERDVLKRYLSQALNSLKDGGVLVLDLFGGSNCHEPTEEETVHEGYSYFWDQVTFDPITNEGLFNIHFRRKGEKKRNAVFAYDWRLWSLPEIRDLLREAGADEVNVYWEGTTKKGEGNGKYNLTKVGEPCDAWIAYVAARKAQDI